MPDNPIYDPNDAQKRDELLRQLYNMRVINKNIL